MYGHYKACSAGEPCLVIGCPREKLFALFPYSKQNQKKNYSMLTHILRLICRAIRQKNSAAIQSKSSIIVLRIVETKNVRRIWKMFFNSLDILKILVKRAFFALDRQELASLYPHFHLNHTKKSSENRLQAWPKTQKFLPRRRTDNLKSRSPLTCTRLSTSKAITNWFWSSEL